MNIDINMLIIDFIVFFYSHVTKFSPLAEGVTEIKTCHYEPWHLDEKFHTQTEQILFL